MKYKIFILLGIIMFMGCTKKEIQNEITSLINNPGSAKGSDLLLALCGWPTQERLHLISLSMALSLNSNSASGSGTIDVSAKNEQLKCTGHIFFTYSSVYMGGHGSGGTEINLGILTRENDVVPEIVNPPHVKQIKIGETINGKLSKSSIHLPDKSLADFYSIELTGNDPAIRINLLDVEKGLHPVGCIYQNKKFISTFISFLPESPFIKNFNEMRLKPGKILLMVTAYKKTGRYTIMLEELDEKTRSKLLPPRR